MPNWPMAWSRPTSFSLETVVIGATTVPVTLGPGQLTFALRETQAPDSPQQLPPTSSTQRKNGEKRFSPSTTYKANGPVRASECSGLVRLGLWGNGRAQSPGATELRASSLPRQRRHQPSCVVKSQAECRGLAAHGVTCPQHVTSDLGLNRQVQWVAKGESQT